jgi:hypothetical protein
VTANLLDTSQSTIHATPAKSTTSGSAKFIATSSANLSLCLYKDSRFAKLFGAATASPRPIPTPSYALFAVRDCLTVFASFNLPPLLAPMLPLSHQMQKHCSALSAAQFIAPAAVQLLSTPLHLLGLDLYNRHARLGFGDRFAKVGRDWLKSSLARMARIVPAFGVGGVVNTRVRASLIGVGSFFSFFFFSFLFSFFFFFLIFFSFFCFSGFAFSIDLCNVFVHWCLRVLLHEALLILGETTN